MKPVYEAVRSRGNGNLKDRAESIADFIPAQTPHVISPHTSHFSVSHVEPTEQLRGYTPHLCKVLSVWRKATCKKD